MASMSADDILALAAAPVPVGIGVEVVGDGPYMYVKKNVLDGSTRCFRFRTEAAAMEAMAAGMAADTPLPGSLAEA